MRRFLFLVAVLHLIDALRLRWRIKKLDVLPPSDMAPDPEHVFWTAPGLDLDDATRRSASAWAREKGLQVLDIWPDELPALQAERLVADFNPDAFKTAKLATGRTAGQAMLVHRELIARSGVETPTNPMSFALAARRLKRYTSAYGLALAPGLRGVAEDKRWQGRMVITSLQQLAPLAFILQLWWITLPARGLRTSRLAGLAALAALHLKPVIAFRNTQIKPSGLALSALLRTPLDVWGWLQAALLPRPLPGDGGAKDRAEYASMLSGGVERFFEPRATQCPICSSASLEPFVTSTDLLQLKPGRFTLERCTTCEHIFQNPRLTPDGLNFYYRDFYDGSGAELSETIADLNSAPYTVRAKSVEGLIEPKRWLDVGSAWGQFCYMARDTWPNTRFDGLDMGDGIDEAERRGWIDTAYRGFFPDIVAQLEGQYDVVSMSHYLEHTRDPRAEIMAAHRALKPGGILTIEVPNPDSTVGRLLNRWSLSWFQPQHQHFVNATNFNRLFEEAGFTAVKWYYPSSIGSNLNFVFATWLMLNSTFPPTDRPWQPRRSLRQKLLATAVWTVSPLLALVALLVDLVVEPLLSRPPRTTNYGVVARRL